ncbi:hypothetical protein IE53DRAFT_382697 [Violaceomyces palustris]|uniref:Uncharacterized protein n=1 Tax=Violaceomyces palustris TaxID=1673888 RepID=A0ACD0NLK7_9BASI|nr:hypothetical protein IE53DRAFT_382697 [Violaceomyces palustris]
MEAISEGTFQGYVSTTHDALLIFEAVRRGIMPKITRRLREDERRLIRSGTVFVFDERESGIKRWTDGLLWSPSRILWNFLVYRQIDKKSVKPPADQPAFATSPPGFPLPSAPSGSVLQSSHGVLRPMTLVQSPDGTLLDDPIGQGTFNQYGPPAPASTYQDHGYIGNGFHHARSVSDSNAMVSSSNWTSNAISSIGSSGHAASGMIGPAGIAPGSPIIKKKETEFERSLVGSLTNSYPFLKEGLCKKTISIQVEGSTQHLISYYTVDDVRSGRLRTPSSLPEIAALCISPIFLNKSNFRNPPHIEVGPDGIPRYRGDMAEGSAARPSGHNSGSEGTTSGSESRETKSMGSPSLSLVPYSPTQISDGSSIGFDPYHRHPHQIGGSGLFPGATLSSASAHGISMQRRTSEVQLRHRSASRFEPYPQGGHGHSSPTSPYYSPPTTPYFQNPQQVQGAGTLTNNRRSSSSAVRGWPFGSQTFQAGQWQSTPPGISSSGATSPAGASHMNSSDGSHSEPYYPFPSQTALAGHQRIQHQPSPLGTLGLQTKVEQRSQFNDSSFQLQPPRPYRASWDAGGSGGSSNLASTGMATNPYSTDTSSSLAGQTMSSMPVYSQPPMAHLGEDNNAPSPPSSSSYTSHQSFGNPNQGMVGDALTSRHQPVAWSKSFSSGSHTEDKRAQSPSSFAMPPPAAPGSASRWASSFDNTGETPIAYNNASPTSGGPVDAGGSSNFTPSGAVGAPHEDSSAHAYSSQEHQHQHQHQYQHPSQGQEHHALHPQTQHIGGNQAQSQLSGWQTEPSGSIQTVMVKQEDQWDSMYAPLPAPISARYRLDDGSRPGSADSIHRRASTASSVETSSGLERVMLTKPGGGGQ